MSKFTPGPWRNGKEADDALTRSIYSPDNLEICFLSASNPLEFRGEQEANARLIAAAPNLLEACKEVLNMPPQFNIPCDLVNKLGQVIAKAEGLAKCK